MFIDSDELSIAMYRAAFEQDTDLQKWDSGCWIRYKLFEQVLLDVVKCTKEDDLISRVSLYDKVKEAENISMERLRNTSIKLPNGNLNPMYFRLIGELTAYTICKEMVFDEPKAHKREGDKR